MFALKEAKQMLDQGLITDDDYKELLGETRQETQLKTTFHESKKMHDVGLIDEDEYQKERNLIKHGQLVCIKR